MNNNKTNMIYTDAHIESDLTLRSFALFLQTSRELLKYVDTCLRQKTGISMVHFMALMILENEGGKMTPTKLASLTQTKRHNITTLIRRMEKEGYINIRKKSRDRRSLNVLFTEKGKAALAHGYVVGD